MLFYNNPTDHMLFYSGEKNDIGEGVTWTWSWDKKTWIWNWDDRNWTWDDRTGTWFCDSEKQTKASLHIVHIEKI